MKKTTGLVLAIVLFSIYAMPISAQEKDKLVACIEEVKQLRDKEGPEWFEKNKTSCLGEEAMGKFSVLRLGEYAQKEVYNDMELEFWAFFDTPVAGATVREGQMEYQKTKKPMDRPGGYRGEVRFEEPGIGNKSLHWFETSDVDIASSITAWSPIWANDYIYEELMVIVGECSFVVGGRAKPNSSENQAASWMLNHYVSWSRELIVNSQHDHGEERIKERMRELASDLVGRIAGVCGDEEETKKETKKGGVADWAKGLLSGPKPPETGGGKMASAEGEWASVKFVEGLEQNLRKRGQVVNDWIIENLGETDFGATVMERQPKIPLYKLPADVLLRQLVEKELTADTVIETEGGVISIGADDGGWGVFVTPWSVWAYSPESGFKKFRLQKGEIEIKTKGERIDVEAPNARIKTKGTHYWVSYDSDEKKTTVGVYEGEVEVVDREGKTISVAPDGERPGVVVVGQKPAIWKLLVLSGVVVGGVVTLILGRKLMLH